MVSCIDQPVVTEYYKHTIVQIEEVEGQLPVVNSTPVKPKHPHSKMWKLYIQLQSEIFKPLPQKTL